MSTAIDFAAAAHALLSSLTASTSDPADAIRLLSQLVSYKPVNVTSASPTGQAMGTMQAAANDLFRRAVITEMAEAATTYQPASADDAVRIRDVLCAALDAEITLAGDQHQDATFNALRMLRTAVVQDLTVRATGLPNIVTISTPATMPATALAHQLYRDPSRADELVTQANCPHPAFMPTSFKGLSK
jgi:prophage DNA circulation protein